MIRKRACCSLRWPALIVRKIVLRDRSITYPAHSSFGEEARNSSSGADGNLSADDDDEEGGAAKREISSNFRTWSSRSPKRSKLGLAENVGDNSFGVSRARGQDESLHARY